LASENLLVPVFSIFPQRVAITPDIQVLITHHALLIFLLPDCLTRGLSEISWVVHSLSTYQEQVPWQLAHRDYSSDSDNGHIRRKPHLLQRAAKACCITFLTMSHGLGTSPSPPMDASFCVCVIPTDRRSVQRLPLPNNVNFNSFLSLIPRR
jgi:hypothetical protein